MGYLNEQEIAGMEQQQWRCLKGVIDTRKKKNIFNRSVSLSKKMKIEVAQFVEHEVIL